MIKRRNQPTNLRIVEDNLLFILNCSMRGAFVGGAAVGALAFSTITYALLSSRYDVYEGIHQAEGGAYCTGAAMIGGGAIGGLYGLAAVTGKAACYLGKGAYYSLFQRSKHQISESAANSWVNRKFRI